jgi:carbon storage regulator
MLVLNRKKNERIAIEGGVTLIVLSVEGGRVRFGVDAPDDIPILRGELSFWVEQPDGSSRGRPSNREP